MGRYSGTATTTDTETSDDHSNNMTASDNTGRPRRGKARYTKTTERGYLAELNAGKLPGQSFFAGYFVGLMPPTILNSALSNGKVEHKLIRFDSQSG